MGKMVESKGKSDYKRRFEEALRIRDSGQLAEAVAALRVLVQEQSGRPEAELILGGLYLEQGNYAEALKLFTSLTGQHPASEKSSLGLFLSLWHLGRSDDAVAEMRRYLKGYDSMEYRRLRRDLEEEGLL